MDFKGIKGQWFIDYSEQYMNGSNVLCTPISTNQVINLCDVYGDDDTAKANALLISKAPEILEEIQDTIDELKLLKSTILEALKTNNKLESVVEVIQNWIDRKEQLIKEATEL